MVDAAWKGWFCNGKPVHGICLDRLPPPRKPKAFGQGALSMLTNQDATVFSGLSGLSDLSNRIREMRQKGLSHFLELPF